MPIPPRRLSAWSVVAMVLAIGMCPFVTAAAIPAGLWALRDISRNGRYGRRLAIVAIVLAVIVTPITTFGAIWWTSSVRNPMMSGPAQIIAAGQRGDVAGFLVATGGEASEVPARAFLKALTQKWGILRSTRQSTSPSADASPDGSEGVAGWWFWIPYEAMFEQAAVPMRARFLMSIPKRGWVMAFDRFEFDVKDGATMHWPPKDSTP
jgi:hypothetical protein